MESTTTQFQNNRGILTDDDFSIIQRSNIVIVGLGGLGGHFANNIVRLGVEHITLIDFDSFDESNLNRQLFSNHSAIGTPKATVLKDALLNINPNCIIHTHIEKIENIDMSQFDHADFIIDAVDTPTTKIYLSALSTTLNIPLLHGACAGWYGQIGWILPGCALLQETYEQNIPGLEDKLLNPSFMPSAIAAIMTSEFVKFIQGSKETIINQLLLIDLYNNTTIKTGDTNG